MDLNDVRFESSMGRLTSMQSLVTGYQDPSEILLDLARHALSISINAKIAKYNAKEKADMLCSLSCDFGCHYDELARLVQIKGVPVSFADVPICDFEYESSIAPQLLNLLMEMKSCLDTGFVCLTSVGDKSVVGKICNCIEDAIYCLTECINDPAE